MHWLTLLMPHLFTGIAMKSISITAIFFITTMCLAAHGQGMKLGEVVIVSTSTLKKDAKVDAFKTFINAEAIKRLKDSKPPVTLHAFQADRGKRKGDVLLVYGADTPSQREAFTGSPFRDELIAASGKKPSQFLNSTHKYTEYRLIGADKFTTRPDIGLLGIHYIKVKKEKAARV
jgi:hypothetical protein